MTTVALVAARRPYRSKFCCDALAKVRIVLLELVVDMICTECFVAIVFENILSNQLSKKAAVSNKTIVKDLLDVWRADLTAHIVVVDAFDVLLNRL